MDFKEKFAMSIDYLFGEEVSSVIQLEDLNISTSKRTGKMKEIWLKEYRIATIRSDGSLAITLIGARLLAKHHLFNGNCVVVQKGPDKFISNGKSLFAKHVVKSGKRIRPGCDVAIKDVDGNVIAVGKALLSSKMMEYFNRGAAVRVRESSSNNHSEI